MQAIGTNVRRLREAAGLSQESLGAQAGVHPNTVKNLERFKLETTQLSTIEGIARVLGVEVEVLMFRDDVDRAAVLASLDRFFESERAAELAVTDEEKEDLRAGSWRFGPLTPRAWEKIVEARRLYKQAQASASGEGT
jgi:transcriptional regulator with XRE-family HTH domain